MEWDTDLLFKKPWTLSRKVEGIIPFHTEDTEIHREKQKAMLEFRL